MWNVDCTVTTAVDASIAVIATIASSVIMFALRSKWKPWYESLNKAPWTPPDWVFGLVWALLYASLAASGITARYYYEQPSNTTSGTVNLAATILFYLMWAGLLMWAPVFFFARSINFALAILIVLTLVSIATNALFWVIYFVPGLIMMPYLLWLLYALSLSIYVVAYNGSNSKLKTEDLVYAERQAPISTDLIGSTKKKNVAFKGKK